MAATGGWVEELDQRAKLAAGFVNDRIKKALSSAGAPWRHDKVSDALALQRIAEWNTPTPAIQKAASSLSEREAVAAALDAVKRITRAEKHGQWPPVTSPAPTSGGSGAPP